MGDGIYMYIIVSRAGSWESVILDGAIIILP